MEKKYIKIFWSEDHSHQWLPAQLCHQCWPQWSDPCYTWGSRRGWWWWVPYLEIKKGWKCQNICFIWKQVKQCASFQSSYQVSQGCGRSSSGRRCGSLFHQKAGMSLLTSPADLQTLFINYSLTNSQFQLYVCTMSIITYMSQYQH